MLDPTNLKMDKNMEVGFESHTFSTERHTTHYLATGPEEGRKTKCHSFPAKFLPNIVEPVAFNTDFSCFSPN
jgi:hypothetical protein